MAHVGGMGGALMIVHGLIDENVHFRHTARLINALIGARKDYKLMLLPGVFARAGASHNFTRARARRVSSAQTSATGHARPPIARMWS
jgi:dipeptidyl aminopeptidase/acylaminoacyl peptidase